MNLKNISICTFKLTILVLQVQIQAFQLPKQLSEKIAGNVIKNATLAILSGTCGFSLLNGHKNQQDIEKLRQDGVRYQNAIDEIEKKSHLKLAALERTIWETRKQIETPLQKQTAIGIVSFPIAYLNNQGRPQGGGVVTIKSLASRPGDGSLALPVTAHSDIFKSFKTANDFIRANADALNIDHKDMDEQSVMTYISSNTPNIPCHGLSSGAAITAALISTYANRPIKQDYAITGKILEDGTIGNISSLEYKIPAVQAAGIKHLIVPKANEPDIKKLTPDITQGVTIIYVSHMNEILAHLLHNPLDGTIAQGEIVSTIPRNS